MFTSSILCVNVRSSRQVEKHETWRKKSRCMKSDWGRRAICPHLGNPPILLWENIFDVRLLCISPLRRKHLWWNLSTYVFVGAKFQADVQFALISETHIFFFEKIFLKESLNIYLHFCRTPLLQGLLQGILSVFKGHKDHCKYTDIQQFFKMGTFQVFLFDKEISPAGAVGLHLPTIIMLLTRTDLTGNFDDCSKLFHFLHPFRPNSMISYGGPSSPHIFSWMV